MAVSKFNIGRRPRGITFRIVAHPNDPEIGKVEILDIDGDFTADDRTETVENKVDQCCQWLREFLSPDTTLQSAVETAAAENGFSKSTLYRAKKHCGVVSKKHQFSGAWEWTLPEDAQAPIPPFENLRENLRGDTGNSGVFEDAHPPENPEDAQAEGVRTFGENDHFSTLSEFDEFAPAESSELPPEPPPEPSVLPLEEHVYLAAMIRKTLGREEGKNVVKLETDILPQFGGDRVPASAFLTTHGFDVVEGRVYEKTENIAG